MSEIGLDFLTFSSDCLSVWYASILTIAKCVTNKYQQFKSTSGIFFVKYYVNGIGFQLLQLSNSSDSSDSMTTCKNINYN